MLNKISFSFIFFFCLCGIYACKGPANDVELTNDQKTNFETLWKIIDENYCYFIEKNVDWDEVHERYSTILSERKMNHLEFFDFLSDMVRELKDGHTSLISSFDIGRYDLENEGNKKSLDYDIRMKYIENYRVSRGMYYCIIHSRIKGRSSEQKYGYILYHSFMNSIGDMFFMSNYFKDCDGIILDLRGNGGGMVTNSDELLSYFITEKQLVGYTKYKISPKRNDFSEPKALYVSPSYKMGKFWKQTPITVLQDGKSYSATNDFIYKAKFEPNITTIGLKTGGGGGMPFVFELPNGWKIRLSTTISLDRHKNDVENGVEPEVKSYLKKDGNIDDLIETAINVINEKNKQ